MALSNPRSQYGIYSMLFKSKTDGIPYGILKVLGDVSISGEPEKKELYGGSNPVPWDIMRGKMSLECSFKAREFHPMLPVLAGHTRATVATEATGSVAIANIKGTSVSGSGGISSIALTSADSGDLKTGTYTISAASATTVNIYYASSEMMAAAGNAAIPTDDLLKINSSPVTLTTGANTGSPWNNLGFTPTGGTVAMTTGDSAKITVYAPHTGIERYTLLPTSTPLNVECVIFGQQKTNKNFMTLVVPSCSLSSVPLMFKEQDWLEMDLKLDIYYDTTSSGIYIIEDIKQTV